MSLFSDLAFQDLRQADQLKGSYLRYYRPGQTTRIAELFRRISLFRYVEDTADNMGANLPASSWNPMIQSAISTTTGHYGAPHPPYSPGFEQEHAPTGLHRGKKRPWVEPGNVGAVGFEPTYNPTWNGVCNTNVLPNDLLSSTGLGANVNASPYAPAEVAGYPTQFTSPTSTLVQPADAIHGPPLALISASAPNVPVAEGQEPWGLMTFKNAPYWMQLQTVRNLVGEHGPNAAILVEVVKSKQSVITEVLCQLLMRAGPCDSRAWEDVYNMMIKLRDQYITICGFHDYCGGPGCGDQPRDLYNYELQYKGDTLRFIARQLARLNHLTFGLSAEEYYDWTLDEYNGMFALLHRGFRGIYYKWDAAGNISGPLLAYGEAGPILEDDGESSKNASMSNPRSNPRNPPCLGSGVLSNLARKYPKCSSRGNSTSNGFEVDSKFEEILATLA
ncbi:hypothetical protein FRC11_008557, partial [Ceratobasidium sp. 423]